MVLEKFCPGEAFKEYVELASALSAEASAVGPSGNGSACTLPSRVYQVERVTSTDVSPDYLVPPQPCVRYGERVEPLRAKLLYFFIQAPAPDAPAGTILRIAPTLQESLQRVREVTYDRGTVVDELAKEAQRMSAARERLSTFEDYCSALIKCVFSSIGKSLFAGYNDDYDILCTCLE